MNAIDTRFANFVIGGTEKAGTTSVFEYLSQHHQVCASLRKETDFFREGFTGNLTVDARLYAELFAHSGPDVPVLMEASPGYLGEASTVAPRIRALAPRAKILFILRDPLDRLLSSYHFHRGRLNLPQSMSFEDYVTRCIEFDKGVKTPQQLGLDDWYLKVLRFGCYAELLLIFRSQIPEENLKVMFFEDLREDALGFMIQLSDFLGIDRDFWSGFEFHKSNVTFSGRNKVLHRVAMRLNTVAEPLLRHHPGLKQSVVRAYKALNQKREGYDPMSASVRQQLIDFYTPGVVKLQRELGVELPSSWHYLTKEYAACA